MTEREQMKHIPMLRYRPVAPPKTCDQCGQTPCETRGLCYRFRQIEREIRQSRAREWREVPAFEPERPKPAESTMAAYEYLRRLNDSERLQRWLDQHPEIEQQIKQEAADLETK